MPLLIAPWVHTFFGIHTTVPHAGHMLARFILMYVISIIMLRIYKGSMTNNNVFNFLINFIIGSLLASALVAERGFFNILVTYVLIMTFNWFVGWVAYLSRPFERLVSGPVVVLVKDGDIQWHAMRRSLVTKDELLQAMHYNNIGKVEHIHHAYLENNGAISIVKKESQ